MSDMLTIGGSALLAYRSALNVVSNNIANANTAGYSREEVDLQALPGITTSSGSVGTGVLVQSVQRLSDASLQAQLAAVGSSYSRANILQGYATQLDSLLSDSSTGLAAPLQSFVTDLNSLTADPTSTATRETLLTDAQGLATSFNGLQQQMNALGTQVNTGVGATVSQINGYASQLAQLNLQISQSGTGSENANGLLDQRDELLQKLASDVGINSVTNADGSVNVFLGSGQPLVLGGTASSLAVASDAFGQGEEITLDNAGTSTVITQQLSGGSLGGMLDFKREILQPAEGQLGQVALGLADAVNSQHALGIDQYGQLGGTFFSGASVAVTSASSNSGSASLAATVTDLSKVGSNDQVVSYNGTKWTMTDASTGVETPLSGSGTAADPLTGDGLSLTLSGSATAGDRFLVQPTSQVAGSLQVAITDPARIAAAAPLASSASTSNAGSGVISGVTATDPDASGFLSTATILFTGASTYILNGAGPNTYTSGETIEGDGWTVQISGTPAAGDSFTVSANGADSGDASNAQALGEIVNQSLLNGGNDTIATASAALVAKVGTQAQQASSQLTTETAIQTQIQSANSAVSGVNLDEEASDMMRFQQAYQAAAQVISTSQTIFQSLLTAIQAT